MSERTVRIQINYKSRSSMVFDCEKFSLKQIGSKVSEASWTNAFPNPLFINIDEIESVWQLETNG